MLIFFMRNVAGQVKVFKHEGFHILKVFKMGFFLGTDMLNLTSKLPSGFVIEADYEGAILTCHYLSSGVISHKIIA
jgi:hypothetical protein